MEEKLLPIGSVVSIGDPDKSDRASVVIAGYAGMGSEGVVRDYIGFIYPFGYLNRERVITMDRHVIREVLYEGYKDEAYEAVIKRVEEKLKEQRGDKKDE